VSLKLFAFFRCRAPILLITQNLLVLFSFCQSKRGFQALYLDELFGFNANIKVQTKFTSENTTLRSRKDAFVFLSIRLKFGFNRFLTICTHFHGPQIRAGSLLCIHFLSFCVFLSHLLVFVFILT
jgi:hypothetical protein